MFIILPDFRKFWESFDIPLAPSSVPAPRQFPDTHQLGDFFVLDVPKRQSSRDCRQWREEKKEKKSSTRVRRDARRLAVGSVAERLATQGGGRGGTADCDCSISTSDLAALH